MKVKFNEAQLSRVQRESLINIVYNLQADNEVEIEVSAIEFPDKLMFKGDDNIGLVFLWDPDMPAYVPLEKPEPEPESLTETKPEPELDLAPVFEHSKAIACSLVDLYKPLNVEQRTEMLIRFFSVLFKELWK